MKTVKVIFYVFVFLISWDALAGKRVHEEGNEPANKRRKLDGKAMLDAAWKGDIERVRNYLDTGTQVNFNVDNSMTALHFAAWRGRMQ